MMTAQLPYFDGAEVELDAEEGANGLAPSTAEADAMLRAFLSLTPADRLADTRHVYAYYQDFREAVGEESLDEDMDVPETPEAIWKHVTPKVAFLMKEEDGSCFLAVKSHCDWEPEHGLWMVWRDGRTLCKVGGDDGHPTNVAAYADADMTNVIYASIDENFRTYTDR